MNRPISEKFALARSTGFLFMRKAFLPPLTEKNIHLFMLSVSNRHVSVICFKNPKR